MIGERLTVVEIVRMAWGRLLISLVIGALLGWFLTSCQAPEPRKYELQTGEIVVCKHAYGYKCGMSLVDCDDGQSYLCQTGVREIIEN